MRPRHTSPDRRVSIALTLLATVVSLIAAQHLPSTAPAQPLQFASAALIGH